MIALHDARVAPANIAAVYSVVVDALTRRLLELRSPRPATDPGVEFAWLALGSQARREAMPSSDVDSAIVWFGVDADERRQIAGCMPLGRTVVAGLEACGLQPDAHGATASDELFVRSLESWQRAVGSWIDDPTQDKALILSRCSSTAGRCGASIPGPRWPTASAWRRATRRCCGCSPASRSRTARRPASSGDSSSSTPASTAGRLDLKHGGVTPIVDLARWAGIAAGVTSASTTERLRAAAAAGTLSEADARTLEDAFELITGLRLEHQVEQLRARRPARRLRQPGDAQPAHAELPEGGIPRRGFDPEARGRRAQRRSQITRHNG